MWIHLLNLLQLHLHEICQICTIPIFYILTKLFTVLEYSSPFFVCGRKAVVKTAQHCHLWSGVCNYRLLGQMEWRARYLSSHLQILPQRGKKKKFGMYVQRNYTAGKHDFLFLKQVPNAHQSCIYLIKIIRTVIL